MCTLEYYPATLVVLMCNINNIVLINYHILLFILHTTYTFQIIK